MDFNFLALDDGQIKVQVCLNSYLLNLETSLKLYKSCVMFLFAVIRLIFQNKRKCLYDYFLYCPQFIKQLKLQPYKFFC